MTESQLTASSGLKNSVKVKKIFDSIEACSQNFPFSGDFEGWCDDKVQGVEAHEDPQKIINDVIDPIRNEAHDAAVDAIGSCLQS